MSSNIKLDSGWDWKLSRLPGRVVQVLSVNNASNVFYAALAGGKDEVDKGQVGLYQSLDSCKTWKKISDFNSGCLYYHQFADYLLVGGYDSSEVLWYRNGQYNLEGQSPVKITLPGELGNVVNIDGKQASNFEDAIYVAQDSGITFTNSIRNSAPWLSLKVNGDMPSLGYPSRIIFMRLQNNRLYCTLDPYDYRDTTQGVGAVVSEELVAAGNPAFSIFFKPDEDLTADYDPVLHMGDVAVIDGKTIVSCSNLNTGKTGIVVYSDDIFSGDTQWNIGSIYAMNGAPSFCEWYGFDYAFMYALQFDSSDLPRLSWFDFREISKPFENSDINGITISPYRKPRPYVTSNGQGNNVGNNIYLPCDQGVYISPIYVE
jgi:hypothetical protein